MPDEVKPNAKEAPTQDAQLAAENIASGEEKAPTVDIEADYKAAQQFNVSDVDRTGEGAKANSAATEPAKQVKNVNDEVVEKALENKPKK